jgi:hypothetical protein
MEEAKKLKENAELIGKCFRYRNSSGDASWWLYGMVTGVDKRGRIVMWDFEQCGDEYKDGDGRIQVRFEHIRNGMTDWEEISRKGFEAEWVKLATHVINSSRQKLEAGTYR